MYNINITYARNMQKICKKKSMVRNYNIGSPCICFAKLCCGESIVKNRILHNPTESPHTLW